MMSLDALCVALKKERARIRRVELDTEFQQGMAEGLLLAVAIAKDIYKQGKRQ